MTIPVIVWFLAVYGLTFFLLESQITQPARAYVTGLVKDTWAERWWESFTSCYFCCGWWVSLFMWITASEDPFKLVGCFWAFAGATMASFLSVAWHSLGQLSTLLALSVTKHLETLENSEKNG